MYFFIACHVLITSISVLLGLVLHKINNCAHLHKRTRRSFPDQDITIIRILQHCIVNPLSSIVQVFFSSKCSSSGNQIERYMNRRYIHEKQTIDIPQMSRFVIAQRSRPQMSMHSYSQNLSLAQCSTYIVFDTDKNELNRTVPDLCCTLLSHGYVALSQTISLYFARVNACPRESLRDIGRPARSVEA